MADAQLLRNTQIVQNASVGTTPAHPPVQVGAPSLVQVKASPGGPQVKDDQRKPVRLSTPKDPKLAAVHAGGHPMVQVKMTRNGVQLDDGLAESPVVILPPQGQKHVVASGGIPTVHVRATSPNRPYQTAPNYQSVRPQVQGAPPVLSQPRTTRFVVPPTGIQRGVTRVAVPQQTQQQAPQVTLPPVPELSTDQLMLCRHLVDKHHSELLSQIDASASSPETPIELPDNVKIAQATIAAIDDTLIAVAVRAEAAEKAAAAAAEAAAAEAAAAEAAAAAAPAPVQAPAVTRVAPRPVTRSYVMPGARPQHRSAGMAPRRVSRSGSLPTVIVTMQGKSAVVQNQAEVAEARQAAIAAKRAEAMPADIEELIAPPTDGTTQG